MFRLRGGRRQTAKYPSSCSLFHHKKNTKNGETKTRLYTSQGTYAVCINYVPHHPRWQHFFKLDNVEDKKICSVLLTANCLYRHISTEESLQKDTPDLLLYREKRERAASFFDKRRPTKVNQQRVNSQDALLELRCVLL